MEAESSSKGGRATTRPDADKPAAAERRETADRRRGAAGEQRRYNRRSPVSDVPPPYYETFERIASALERIEQVLFDQFGQTDVHEADAAQPPGLVPPARDSRRG